MRPWVRPVSRGFILPVVLLVLAALSAMAAILISGTRTELAIARNIRAAAEAEAIADAGIFYMLSELARRNYPQSRSSPETSQFGGGSLKISVNPESGKIDLNKGHKELIEGIIAYAGLSSSQARRTAIRIEAYRDVESGRIFTSISQFGAVFKLAPDVIEKLRPLTTVYTALPGIAPGAASESVLSAIPGFRKSGVASMLANRDSSVEFTPEDLATLRRYTIRGIPVYTIISEAVTKKGARFRRLAVVNMEVAGNPVFYEWRQMVEPLTEQDPP